MPIYEYQCQKCGNELEALQKISDAPLTDCPECGAAELRKKVSAAAFRLKGGGWYETDFKSGKKKNVHDAGDSKPSDSKQDSKSTTKPASGSTTTSKKAGDTKN
jgi:putative FmdB family regulatory protein